MTQQGSNGSPEDWQWKLQIERRVIWLEFVIKEIRGKKTTDGQDRSPRFTPRDWLMTGAGITLVLGSLSEKSGVTAAGAMLLKAVVRLYGQK